MCAASSDPSASLPRPLLLVVDDEPVIRETVDTVLSHAGFQVVTAKDGRHALEQFRTYRPDIVLMDVMMPEMDGFAACTELRRQAGHDVLPILMLTGLSDVGSVERAFDSGATDFITKPINWALLSQRVRYALRAREMDSSLRREQERLTQAQRIARLGYWELDLVSGRLHCSDELLEIFGCTPVEGRQGMTEFLQMVHPDDRSRVRRVMARAIEERRSYLIDYGMLRADGTVWEVQQQGKLEFDDQGVPLRVVGTLQDITERKRAEALIDYQTYYDGVTDVPNRRLFSERLRRALAAARQRHSLVGVIFLGLDRFRVINDTMGHGAGDLLLTQLAERLKAALDPRFTVARFGNDVFCILLDGLDRFDEVHPVVQGLEALLSEPFAISGHEYFATASLGISLFPLDCDDEECLLKAADTAMFRAKEQGGTQYQFYTAVMNEQVHEHLRLENNIRRALERGEFTVCYQPQVEVATGRVIALEALVRWHHPELGTIPPERFVPVAEQSGMVVQLGEWMLRAACEQLVRLHRAGHGSLRVAVNLSPRQFAQHGLVEKIREILTETGLAPDALEVEVTEGVAMEDVQASAGVLHRLREAGVTVSLDDFGTGYSSLSHLQRLPIHTLKIDRSFVEAIHGTGEGGAIVKAIIALAHSLDMSVVAEGVETAEQYAYLRDKGCDLVQGYLFSPPLTAEKIGDWLADMRGRDTGLKGACC